MAAGWTTFLLERFWKSVKDEDPLSQLLRFDHRRKKGSFEYLKFYYEKRWHQKFDRKTPSMVCFDSLAQKPVAA